MASSTASSQQSAKKQQSISNFFTKKVAKTKTTPTLVRNTTENSIAAPYNTEDDKENDDALFIPPVEDENFLQTNKRRSCAREEAGEHGLARHDSTCHGSAPDNPKIKRRKLSETISTASQADQSAPSHTPSRTSKYVFSSPPASMGSEEHSDRESRALKEQLHRKFVKKLGRPDSITDLKRRNWQVSEESTEAQFEGDDAEEDPEERRSKIATDGRKGMTGKKVASKLTPMEKQFLDIKHKHLDTILIVEVGYKYKFFGEDARIAAKELGIVCIPGKMRYDEHHSEAHLDRFAFASIPVHRLHVHVKRLVSAGHKVGVVRQIETAALKAAGDNRNTPFTRKLTNLYTKGTYIDDIDGLEGMENTASHAAPASGYLMCLAENNATGWGTDEKVKIGFVAVQPATGDVIYDEFEDGFMRSELETRLLHIAPCELLIVGILSKATEKLVQNLSGSKSNVFGDQVRIETVAKPKNMAALAYSHVSNFYASKMGTSSQTDDEKFLDKVVRLAESVTLCLSAMITHMTDYGLEHVFDLTRYFQSFSARSHMLLNGTSLTSLEIYQNQTDHSEKGSLFWTLDRTKTRFGRRLLRKWVGRPLLVKYELEARINAVEELLSSAKTANVDRIHHLLSQTRCDLEKSLIRIYYGKCTRPELLTVLQTIQRITTEFAHVKDPSDAGFDSILLQEAIAALPTVGPSIVAFLERMNPQAAKEDDKYNFFRDEHESESIVEHKLGIVSVEQELDAHRVIAAEKLGKNKVAYVTVAGIEYLIEVDNVHTKRVPASWAKISGTKKTSRYHTPDVVKLIRERDQHKEALAAACDSAFSDLLKEISSEYQGIRDCIQALAVLDCLSSLAIIAAQPGYVKPTLTDEICISIRDGRHPMIEQLLLDTYVPNDTDLTSDTTRALLVTGPNMGGKSSYVRQIALIAIMGQIGSYVPATSATLGMLDAVFTRIGAFDNMMAGESTFMVELSETADILKQASPRSLIVLDELGRGTSTHDGVAIAQAVLDYVVRELRALTLFITHYQSLSALANDFVGGELRNVHMKFHEDGEEGQDITFLYEVGEGVAHRSYGLNVARLAQLPGSVLHVASIKSIELEEDARKRSVGYLSSQIATMMEQEADANLEQLITGIEQL